MKAALAAALAVASLSACETLNQLPNEEELATFGQDSNALVLLSATDSFGCGTTTLAFMDMESKASFDRTIPTGDLAAAVVRPGNYQLFFGKCAAAVGDMGGIMFWFDTAEVKPNEVVYLGTFNMDVVDVTAQAGVLDNIFTLGLTALTGTASQYPVYDMRDETGRIRELLRRQYPQFADSMITRVPAAILLREDFAQAFRNAYAPRADGSFPTEEEAQARLDSEIDKAIEASLARYQAAHPQPDRAAEPLVVERPAS